MRLVMASAAMAAALVLGGCAQRGPATPAQTAAPSTVPTASLRTVPPPEGLASTTITLPAGCTLKDHWGDLALFDQLTGVEQPATTLHALDLATGRHRRVLRRAISNGEGFAVSGAHISPGWLAWEEVSADEEEWRLYTAPFDRSTLSIGEESLVDSARSAQRSRPYFGMGGERIVWCCGEGSDVPRTVVRASGLSDGIGDIIYQDDAPPLAMRVRDGVALLTVGSGAEPRAAALALSPADGGVLWRVELENAGDPSHFVDATGTIAAWAAFGTEDLPWPGVFMRVGTGRPQLIEASGCDPNVRGGLVFYEHVDADAQDKTSIECVDPRAGTRSVIEQVDSPAPAGWQFVPAPSAPGDLLVAYRDEYSFPPADREPVTEVKVWRIE